MNFVLNRIQAFLFNKEAMQDHKHNKKYRNIKPFVKRGVLPNVIFKNGPS